jgi:hypothetical protein
MKPSAEVSEKVWFLNKRSGKIGSAALFSCHKMQELGISQMQ